MILLKQDEEAVVENKPESAPLAAAEESVPAPTEVVQEETPAPPQQEAATEAAPEPTPEVSRKC